MINKFTVGELSPKKQTISRFQQSAQATIPIVNRSHVRTQFRLTGADHQGVCHFEFQLPGQMGFLAGHAELWLSPNEAVAVPVRITPPPAPLLGLSKTVHHLTLTTTMLSEAPTSRTVSGQVSGSPLIGPWSITLVTACLFVLTLLGVQLFITSVSPQLQPVETSQATPPSQTNLEAITAALSNLEADTSSLNVVEERSKNRSEMTYEEIFQDIAPQYQLEWQLLAEIAYQESRMNPGALGKDNDMGLMQIIPSTWNEWAPKVGVSDPFDPYSNVLVAAAYLAYIREYAGARGYSEDYWMLVGYNWGPDNLRQLFENKTVKIPAKQNRYALEILRATANGSARWQQ